jgi:phosphoglycolate phosphatase
MLNNLDLSQINHIIWDWNGTLLDDLNLCLTTINSMLAERGLEPLTKVRYLEIFDFPVQDYYRKLGFDFEQEPFEAVSTQFITLYENGRPGCRLMNGAREMLQFFKGLGYKQTILSASKKSHLQKAVADYHIQGNFQAVLGLDNHHAAGKLSLARAYLNDSLFDPRTMLLIGDTIHDAETAHALDLKCILIPNGHHSRLRLAATGATVVNSLPELMDFLRE